MSNIKINCALADNTDNYFITWLVEKLGPVLYGSKPAELLSFSHSNLETSAKIDMIEKTLGHCNRLHLEFLNLRMMV